MSLVVADLKYLAPTSGKPIYRASTGGAAAKLDMQGEFAVHRVGIQNMRPDAASLSLDCEGFVLIAQLILAILGSDGRNAATILSLRYSPSR
jgi:hypothetical protein